MEKALVALEKRLAEMRSSMAYTAGGSPASESVKQQQLAVGRRKLGGGAVVVGFRRQCPLHVPARMSIIMM